MPATTARRTSKPTRRTATGLADQAQRDLRRLLAEPVDFMDHPDFHLDGAEAAIFDARTQIPRARTAWYSQVAIEGVASQADPAVKPENLPLLNARQERVLFLRYNYCRFRAEQLRAELAGRTLSRIPARKAEELLQWRQRSRELREQLAEYNLALVLAMAQRVHAAHVEFHDLISEGNLALLRAIDKFDVGRGFKFSTYACRAMIKAFGRLGIKMTRYRNRFPVEFDPQLERSNHSEEKAQAHEQDCAEQVRTIFDRNLASLTPVEREVIGHRFAIGDFSREQPLTLEQVGHMVGLTKERVRQIQKAALGKLRDALERTLLSPQGGGSDQALTTLVAADAA